MPDLRRWIPPLKRGKWLTKSDKRGAPPPRGLKKHVRRKGMPSPEGLKAYFLQTKFILSDNRFSFSKRRQLLSESVFPSVAGKNSDWLSLSRAFSVSSDKYSLAVRRKYGFARLFRNLSKKSRLRCFAVLSVRKAYKTRQPNAIVL